MIVLGSPKILNRGVGWGHVWGTLGHWVGSPDLENAHLFGFDVSHTAPKTIKESGHLALFEKPPFFLKALRAAFGAWHIVAASGGTKRVDAESTATLRLSVRCALQAFFYLLRVHSSAACSPASSAEAGGAAQGSTREEERREQGVAGLHSQIFGREFHFVPPFFRKENGPPTTPLSQKIACGA